ncbi:Growth-regulating factor like [Melia azedarach]|uniref:Growth-regulating factor like n=1 Tax=Melia azedarach TaxID=155640 RepID=A0ACC1YXY1_MELAZ|nr:Growth-regulating factor like [Melia azedarach]
MSGSGSFYSSVGQPPPFTVSQWHELEHQALIFKYLKAGLSVPPDLLVPIRTSLHLLSSLGYCSYYGKKMDPEPGRCRRTDGKKWRCSKDAHPGSKYCERHMNRSRYRSRKPVESQTASQPLSTAASDVGTGSSSGSGSFQNLPLHSISNHEGLCFPSKVSQSLLDPTPYGISNREYRSLQGLKAEANDGVISVSSEKMRGIGINSSVDSAWCLPTSQSPASSLSDQRNGGFLQNSCPPLQMLQEFGPLITNDATSRQEQQHYFFGRDFSSSRSWKQESQSLQPLPNQLPKTIDFSYYPDDQQTNKNSLSTTQLSMSIPMVSSEFFGRSGHSSKDAHMDKFLG